MKKTTPEESESIELTENQSEGKTIHQKRLDRQSQQQVKPATAYSLLSVLAVVLVIVFFFLPRFVAENELTIMDDGTEDGNTEVLLNEAVLAQKPIAEALLSEMLSKMDSPILLKCAISLVKPFISTLCSSTSPYFSFTILDKLMLL